MENKVLIIGGGHTSLSALALKEKFGDDVVMLTPEEAKEQGLTMSDFDNIPTMKITPQYKFPENTINGISISGQANRRQRRKNERKRK